MRKCKASDLPGLLDFYQLVIRETEHISVHARWDYGKHPTEASIADYVRQEAMFALEDGQDIVAASAVTPYQTPDYHDVSWQKNLGDREVAVVHLLAVHPRFQNRGYAKKFIREIIRYAGDLGLKTVRLDTLACNIPAQRLYESLGFAKCGTCHWYAENTGWYDFFLYEYLLQTE